MSYETAYILCVLSGLFGLLVGALIQSWSGKNNDEELT